MNIIISNASARPLYEQIEEQIKNEILAGNLTQGEPLPSIRYLARELKVSIITTKRAYDDLEADGFLTTTPGKGTFVSLANLDRLREVAAHNLERLKLCGDHVVFPRVADDFAAGRFGLDGGRLCFREAGQWRPVRTVEYGEDGRRLLS